jgi:hypothetical protein
VRALVGHVRDPGRHAVVTRRVVAVVLVAVALFAACSGDDDDNGSSAAARSTTSTLPSAGVTTALPGASTSAPPGPTAAGSGTDTCGGVAAFGAVAGEWANSQLSGPIEFTVDRAARASADPSWMHARLVPDDRAKYDAVWVVGHCVGKRWQVVDGGTSGVGCRAAVPTAVREQLGVDCP